jgi:hypothetical protein
MTYKPSQEMQDKDKNGKISKEEFAEWYLDDEQRSKLKRKSA